MTAPTPDQQAAVDALGTCITETLDALETMVEQYLDLDPDAPGFYGHLFMSAGEFATSVLARYRPGQWEDTGAGLRRRPT